MFRWGVGCSGERLATADFKVVETDWGGDGEVARVDGFAGVVESCRVGGPVGWSWFREGFADGGKGDLPVVAKVDDLCGGQ